MLDKITQQFSFTSFPYKKQEGQNDQLSTFLFFAFAFGAFIYVVLRAYYMQITHDEAYSFYLVHTNYLSALGTTANTHWLNSFFMKIPNFLGLNHVFFLRLHNVFAFLVYAYFLQRISQLLQTNAARYLLIALFFLNPFTLEYFPLARGYALSFSLLIGALYFALKIVTTPEQRLHFPDFLGTVVFATASVAANYTGLFQFVGLCMLLAVLIYQHTGSFFLLFKGKWRVLPLLFFGTCLIAFINLLLIKFISNDLRYGGDHSFFTDSMNSIWLNSLYIHWKSAVYLNNFSFFTLFSVFIFAGITGIFFYSLYQKQAILLLFSFLFLFNFVCNQVLFFLFNIPFPWFRTTLILYPSMVFGLLFFFDRSSFYQDQKIKPLFALSVFIGMALVLGSTLNVERSYNWKHQAKAKEAFQFIMKKEKHQGKKADRIKIIADNSAYPAWRNYYSQLSNNPYPMQMIPLSRLKTTDTTVYKAFFLQAEYIILSKRFQKKYAFLQETGDLDLLKSYPKAGVSIFAVKRPKK